MGNLIKYTGLGLLAFAAIGCIVLYYTGGATTLIPIDQSLCPTTMETAEDGTCGIYEGRAISAFSYTCMVTGGVGIITYIVGLIQSRKNGS